MNNGKSRTSVWLKKYTCIICTCTAKCDIKSHQGFRGSALNRTWRGQTLEVYCLTFKILHLKHHSEIRRASSHTELPAADVCLRGERERGSYLLWFLSGYDRLKHSKTKSILFLFSLNETDRQAYLTAACRVCLPLRPPAALILSCCFIRQRTHVHGL